MTKVSPIDLFLCKLPISFSITHFCMNLMKISIRFHHFLFLLLGLGLLLFNACDRSPEDDYIPVNTEPAIALVSPTNNNFLDTVGATISTVFRLDDNEQLKLFRVTGIVLDQRNDTVGSEFIVLEETVSGQHILQNFDYLVPNLPPYYKVKLTCFVIDTEGEFSSTVMIINIVPGPSDPEPYEFESYTGDKLYSRRALNNKYYFDFYSRAHIANVLDQDIKEESSTFVSGFSRQLSSPAMANTSNVTDSVFVMTNTARFNYDQCNYTTIYQAYYADALPVAVTPEIQTGDIIIIRLTNFPHFGVMRVTEVKDDPGDANDYIEFDYKVTY